jgi:hypothetical protein
MSKADGVQVANMAAGVRLAEEHMTHTSGPTPEDLQTQFQAIIDQLVHTHSQCEQHMAAELESLQERHLTLQRQFRKLSEGYRQIRYQVEDANSRGNAFPIAVIHEDQLLGAAPSALLLGEEEAQRRLRFSARAASTNMLAAQQQQSVRHESASTCTIGRHFQSAQSAPNNFSSEHVPASNVEAKLPAAFEASQNEFQTTRNDCSRLAQHAAEGQRDYIVRLGMHPHQFWTHRTQ